MKCYFDARWKGEHGIGRFASEIESRIDAVEFIPHGRPMSPTDPLKLALALRNLNESNLFYLSPGYNAPLYGPTPYFITIHDLNHIERPENSSLPKRLYYRLVLRRLCKRAQSIFTVSEYSKSRIVDWLNISPDNVINVGNGISGDFSMSGEKLYGDKKYVLCTGNRKGHKNEKSALAAFASAELGSDVSLVFTGAPSKYLMDYAAQLGIEKAISFAGRLSEAKLAALYRGASVVLFPSYYEGFGLPIVEGFASGVPVVTSNVTSMPEVAGGAAVLVDPYSIDDIRNGLSKAYYDHDLRNRLIADGLRRAQEFTWEKVADKVKTEVREKGFSI